MIARALRYGLRVPRRVLAPATASVAVATHASAGPPVFGLSPRLHAHSLCSTSVVRSDLQRTVAFSATVTLPAALPGANSRRWSRALQQSRSTLPLRRLTVAASLGSGSAAEHNTRNKTALQGKLVDALSLFSQEYLMTVPYAQRPYLWSEGVAEQLLEDLVTMAGAAGSTVVPELPDYQLGTINLLDKPAGSGAFTKKFVYDGQQRIVTLCLLLSALRERLEAAAQGEEGLGEAEREFCRNVAKSLAQKVHQEEDFLIGRPPLPRISLRVQKDTDFLTKLLTDTDFLARADVVPDGCSSWRTSRCSVRGCGSCQPCSASAWPSMRPPRSRFWWPSVQTPRRRSPCTAAGAQPIKQGLGRGCGGAA
ncbi:hypothetical protein ABPG75_000168 [Micractinium tetrahymenae]